MPEPRTGFGPTVLAGVATSALAAVACAKPWYAAPGTGASGAADATLRSLDSGTTYPAASAASLVLLAAWGVLLVTRAGVRRAFALVAALAAVALVGTVVAGYLTLPDSTGPSYDQLMGRTSGEASFTGWFMTAAVAAVLALPPALVAVRRVRLWPEMGSRYDAPATRAGGPSARDEDAHEQPGAGAAQDLWREIDEGRDPTERG